MNSRVVNLVDRYDGVGRVGHVANLPKVLVYFLEGLWFEALGVGQGILDGLVSVLLTYLLKLSLRVP